MMRLDSDLGQIPIDWTINSLADVCSMRSGGTPPKSDSTLWSGDVPWVSGKDLKTRRLTDSIDHITQDAAEAFSRIAPAGSVLVLVRGMGLANGFALSLIERPMAFNQDLKALTPGDELSGAFLMHALTFAGQRMLRNVTDAAHGTKRLTQDDLNSFRLPIPPRDEQLSIAAVLDRACMSIDVERRCLQRMQQLKRSALRDLFTRGLRGEPQKETPIGPLPQSWRLIPAAQIFKLTSGKTRPDGLVSVETAEKPFPVLGGNGVMGYSAEWNWDSEATLVIGRVGEYCGAVHVGSGKIWITDNALYAKDWLCRDVSTKFMAAYLSYYNLNRFRRMAGQPLITQGVINEHSFPTPSLEEQHEIVAILDTIERKTAFHHRKEAVLDDLFKTLLRRLMTGEVRVSDLDLSALQPTAT